MTLIDIDDVKKYIPNLASSPDNDDALQILIDGAEARLRGYIGDDLTHQTYTEYYDGAGTRSLILNHYPVTTLTSFQYNNGTPSTPVRADFEEDNYVLQPLKGMIQYIEGIIPRGYQNIKVVYDAGYTVSGATITMPKDITLAMYKLVDGFLQTKGVEALSKERADDVEVVYRTDNSARLNEAKAILDRYVRYHV